MAIDDRTSQAGPGRPNSSSASDLAQTSVARVYDCSLGGKDNFASDRAAADAGRQLAPDAQETGVANRAFIRRAVRHMALTAGIRQFLDLGSGLPTGENVHQTVHEIDPGCRVVYVDNDPMVASHGRALLAESGTTTVVQADLRRPQEILDHPEVRLRLDFDQPVGVLMFAVLHHINDDEDPDGIAATMRQAVCPGSQLAISHFHDPGDAMPGLARVVADCQRFFNQTFGTGRWRSREEIRGFFGDFDLVEPGLVPLFQWRPDGAPPENPREIQYSILGGVAEKS